MDVCAGSATYVNLIKLLNANNIHYQESWISCTNSQDTCFSSNLTLVCDTIPSSSMNISIMESVLAGIDDADVYIDDLGTFSHIWDDHFK
ncbi:hypothetical protein ACHAW6_004178 [Cyclotella cf. meneghiniana]